MVQMFPDPNLWVRLGYTTTEGDLGYDQDVTLERSPKSIPDFFAKLLTPEETLQVKSHADAISQYGWVAETIKKLIEEDELDHTDFLIVVPNVKQSRSIGGNILNALRAVKLQGHVPGQTSSKDEIFKPGSIAITHIHRAKGNEAPVVFVVDTQFCEGPYSIKRRRNILFTAITRSRAWTYITGVGEAMEQIEREIAAIRRDQYKLIFHYPTREEAERLAVSSDKTQIDPALGSDDFDDLRIALRKAKKTGVENLPADLKRDLFDFYDPTQ